MPQPTQPLKIRVRLDQAALPVPAAPGAEIVLRGSFLSKHDGSTVDAATTSWPEGAPGGASVDAGGLVDLAAGGFQLVSRDPVRHEVRAVATGKAAPACAAAGIEGPCLVLRTLPQARSRLLTQEDWASSLSGGIEVEVPVPPPPPSAMAAAASEHGAAFAGIGAALGLGLVTLAFVRARRRRAASPLGRLESAARRIERKLRAASPVLAAPLEPAVAAAARALRARRVDPTSQEGRRVAEALLRVEARLDDVAARTRAEEEQQAADELVRDVEAALAAADETAELVRR